MTWLLLLALFQIRQVEFEERALDPNDRPEVARALPQNVVSWDHAERGLYEVAPGVWHEVGVDGYTVTDLDSGDLLVDIPCRANVYETTQGPVVLWICRNWFVPLRVSEYVPGGFVRYCIRSYTHDLDGDRHYSVCAYKTIEWESACFDTSAPGPWPSGEDIACNLTELP